MKKIPFDRIVFFSLALFYFLLCIGWEGKAAVTEPAVPLIPKSLLFGNPQKTKPRISPDGLKIAYIAPWNNALNIFVRTLGSSDDKPVTRVEGQGIIDFYWTYDSQRILYLKDSAGDENFQLFGVQVVDGITVNYTAIPETTVAGIHLSPDRPDHVLVLLNKEDPRFHDAYLLNLDTKQLTLEMKNQGNILNYLPDRQLHCVAYVNLDPDGKIQFRIRKPDSDEYHSHHELEPSDLLTGDLLNTSSDGKYLHLIDVSQSETARLIRIDRISDETQVLAVDPEADIVFAVLEPATGQPIAAGCYKDRLHWITIDPEYTLDFETLSRLSPGDFMILNQDFRNNRWIVESYADNKSPVFYLYDRTTKKAEILFEQNDGYAHYKLADMEPFEILSRDGMKLHGYITFPANGQRSNLPMLLKIHGGPYSRDIWGFDPEVQWFANRGFICLQVNFRGSSGYGKQFLRASKKEWGGKMNDDLIDAVNWAIAQGFADLEKIAVYGGSYGGFAALAAATMTPDTFCCAVSFLGPSNLVTFLKTLPSYWANTRKLFFELVGNPETEQEFLLSRSPLTKVDQIKIPILIAQGANDPRVKVSEAEQIIQAMRKKSLRYRYLMFPDEGHRFSLVKNRMTFYNAVERFLGVNLGGRIEPTTHESSDIP